MLLVDEVDRCVTADTLVTTVRGVKRAADVEPGEELVSFDPAAFRLDASRVKKVIPREASRILRIFAGGRLLEVTPEHRFVRYTESGCEVVHASELRTGDRLPLYKRAATPDCREPEFEFPDSIVKLTETAKRRFHAAYRVSGRTYEDLAQATGVSGNHLRNVLQPRSCRGSLRAGTLDSLSRTLGVDERALGPGEISGLRPRSSVALYELFGYIVADGCFTSDRLCIADKDRENLEVYSAKFQEAFGQAARIVKGPHANFELTYHSLPLGRFLTRTLGEGLVRSRQRRVPDFVFSAPTAKRAGFVRGFFDGEGWVGDHQVAASSASPYLLVGIQHLLSSLGVDSQVCQLRARGRSFGKGPYFTLTIGDTRAYATAVGFCSPAKTRRLGEGKSPRFAVTELLPHQSAVGTLSALRSRAVLHGTPTHQTVHDILGGRVRPNASSLRRIAAAFDSPEIADLLRRQVVLGEVTAIETLDEVRPVYDFVLEDPVLRRERNGHPQL